MVTLVATVGRGSMDLYSTKLAEYIGVPTISSDIYQRNAELFNVSFLNWRSFRALLTDWMFVRRLNATGDLLHLPNQHLGRYGCFLKVPYIITVHDLIRYFDLKGYGLFIHRPNLRDRFFLGLDYRGIRRATHIIAVSHTTKRDLMEHLGIPEERISVVYEGVEHSLFRPVERRLFDFPYVLFVGSEHPRKNLPTLIKAFKVLKERTGRRDLRLVKVGRAGGREADFRSYTLRAIREAGLRLDEDVVLTGFVDARDLPAYYSGAEVFVLPSYYEGFGFPPLEAMACGCPVVVSNAGALPEVAGPASLVVDPHDIEGLAEAMQRVMEDEALRDSLVRRGLAHARRFTWERTARETRRVYRRVQMELGLTPTPEAEETAVA